MGLLPKDADILPPSDDRIFKLILASPDGKPALLDLVSALSGRPVTDVAVRNSEIPPEDTMEKSVDAASKAPKVHCANPAQLISKKSADIFLMSIKKEGLCAAGT